MGSLSEIEFGIVMLTQQNVQAPWIMFEAGALSKTVKSRVIPILCDLDRLEIASTPLSQFQNALVTRDEFWSVVVAVNGACTRRLDETRLKSTFDKWWPEFDEKFKKIKFGKSVKPTGTKDVDSRLDKIESGLEAIMRQLQRQTPTFPPRGTLTKFDSAKYNDILKEVAKQEVAKGFKSVVVRDAFRALEEGRDQGHKPEEDGS